MKHLAWLMLVFFGVLVGLAYLAGFPADEGRAIAAPPLSLEGFLDEKLPEAEEKDALEVDNFACHVCHGNYDGEELVVVHGKEGIGCIDCHGKSVDHRNDEDNIIPPDTMYAQADVDRMCSDCHDIHDAPARKVIQLWQERCPGKTDPKEIVCTDCHFQHRLPFRTVWWNKETGELIVRKEGERTKPAADHSAPAVEKKDSP
jgi:hypothetical protein